MTPLIDPPRLIESADAPLELQELLCRAYQDALPATEVEALVRATEQRAAANGHADLVERVGSSFSRTRMRLVMKALIPLAAVGVSVGGWRWFVQSRGQLDSAGLPLASVAVDANTGATATTRPSDRPQPTPTSESDAPAPGKSVPDGRTRHRTAPAYAAASGAGSAMGSRPGAPTRSSAAEPAANDEYSLLAAARRAKNTDPARALGLANEHARMYPHGMLSQEREAIAIEALLALGSTAQAKARASRFAQNYPGSPHWSRIEAALLRSSRAGDTP